MSTLALMLPACSQQHRAGSTLWYIIRAGHVDRQAGHVQGGPVLALEQDKPVCARRKRGRDEMVSQAV